MQKFEKKKRALGITGDSKVVNELERADRQDERNELTASHHTKKTQVVTSKPTESGTTDFDLTEVQELIAVIRSLDYLTSETNVNYERLKRKVESHRIPKFKSAGE